MSDTEKEVIRKQAQDGMDSLIDPLLESTKELIRILESRPTKDAADLPLACANGNHYTNDGNGRDFDFCPDCGKPLI